MNKYIPSDIEAKWQDKWESAKTYSPDIEAVSRPATDMPKALGKPFYNLMMFPYPSAEGLHVGNMYAFTGADVYGRFKRMQGNEVFEPIGLDGFGIHSENYALKVGRHPKEQAELSEKNFYRQLRSIGNGFDLTRTVETYKPDYYKWTQWLFIQMFKNGLAYRKKAEVNWCPSDNTVIADEQVIDGKCERDGATIEKRELEQWFFRITNYAQRLLENIETLDWTNKVKVAQKNWIGCSEGAEIEFEVEGLDDKLKVFTTRPDTLYGATFMVVSPENELVTSLLAESRIKPPKASLAQKGGNQELSEVEEYVKQAKLKTNIERTAEGKEKTGVFSGLYAINPVNGKKLPVWVADYVLSSYGTGAIMAVPAHDQRDFEFAKKYDLDIIPVIKEKDSSQTNVKMEEAFIGQGIIMGSGSWDGFHVPDDIGRIIDDLEARGLASRKVNYHLRDWLISRQRYWGPPIPIIYCRKCWENQESSRQRRASPKRAGIKNRELEYGVDYTNIDGLEHIIHAVPEEDLPVKLPDVNDWKPMGTGKAPLANHPEFYEVKCPACGEQATRETDVSDTFLDSAWYFLRYPSLKARNSKHEILNKSQSQNLNDKKSFEFRNSDLELPWNREITRRWLPVNMYIGGAEHSVLHLLYSRFITMVLNDLGYIDFEEPFSRFYAHGLIIKDGAKMSKSKGNVVVPDEYISKYGADSLRTYLMFLGPFSDGGDFSDSGIEGIFRFMKRVWKLLSVDESGELNDEKARIMNKTIKEVTDDLANLRYNTAIARLMEWYNFLAKFESISTEEKGNYLKLLAPFAPHMTEELFQGMNQESSRQRLASPKRAGIKNQGDFNSIHLEKWPEYDEGLTLASNVTVVIQVNGKRRGEFVVETDKVGNKAEIESLAKDAIVKHLEGQEIKRVIYISGKVINFVV